jgi:hypothetical protein
MQQELLSQRLGENSEGLFVTTSRGVQNRIGVFAHLGIV